MQATGASEVYSQEFFAGQVDGSAKSAAAVVPLVLSLFPARSVIDVGCGVAPWAAEFLAQGVPDVWGVDGDYVNRSQLRISQERFLARDLTKPIRLERTFDLAVCLEVAEHLPQSRARGLVEDLTSLAPVILFSAAIPGQGGTSHVNEQYVSYWSALFAERGYSGIDPIRPLILGNDAIEWFYQQNIVVFLISKTQLRRHFSKPHDIVHRQFFEHHKHAPIPLSALVSALSGAFVRAVQRRLHLVSK